MSVTPVISADSAPLWKGFEALELRLPHCLGCGRAHLPPGPVCPFCLSTGLEWRRASGRGNISTWVVVHRKYFADFDPPYIVVQVELDEGPRLTANMPLAELPIVRMGLPVQASFETAPNGMILPMFRSL